MSSEKVFRGLSSRTCPASTSKRPGSTRGISSCGSHRA
jgi:hypothetical protein